MNTTIDPYLYQFYGPQSHWYALTLSTLTSLIVLSNTFLLAIILSSKSLREKSSSWFLLGFACADLLNGCAHVFNGFAIWNGSIENRHLCSLAGGFVVFTAACGYGFPFLIAADRHYKIIIKERGKFSLGCLLFSDRFIIPLIMGWFVISTMGNIPMLLNHAFGEDPGGFCGARKFTEVRMLILYLGSTISVFAISLILAGVYYFSLVKWLRKQHKTLANDEGMRQTKEIMKFTQVIFIIPVVFATPAAFLSGGQMLLPNVPMWLGRAITLPYFSSSLANPWLTIIFLRPLRRRVLHLLRKARILAPLPIATVVSMNPNHQKPTFIQVRNQDLPGKRTLRIVTI